MGPEIGVASTKAFTGQVTVMAMLALAVGREKGTTVDGGVLQRGFARRCSDLPETLEEVLESRPAGRTTSAKIFTYAHNFIYLGRGYNYPTALEGALKLKEISYIHAEGLPRRRDEARPHRADRRRDAHRGHRHAGPHLRKDGVATSRRSRPAAARSSPSLPAATSRCAASADYVIEVPVIAECLMPIVVSVPLQLLAYYIAVYKGRNVDQPRNLAKSVTVE